MVSVKMAHLNQKLKKRLVEKLDTLRMQKEYLFAMVESAIQPATNAAEELISVEEGVDFQKHFLQVMQNLEHHVNALTLVAASTEQLFDLPDPESIVPDPPPMSTLPALTLPVSTLPASTLSTFTRPTSTPTKELTRKTVSKRELSTATLSVATPPTKNSCVKLSYPADTEQRQVSRITGYLRSTDCHNLILKANQVILVRVSHAEPPNTLWVQPLDTQLHELIMEMCKYFRETKDVQRVKEPVEGMMCATKSGESQPFYRVCIIAIPPNTRCTNKVNVYFVDFGNRGMVLVSQLWHLPEAFNNLPAQAVRCVLSKVYWTAEGNSHVLSVARPQVFKCVTLPTSTPTVPTVSLFLSTQEEGRSVAHMELSDVLVLQRIAFSTTLDPVISTSRETPLTQAITSTCAGEKDLSVEQCTDVVSVQNCPASEKKLPQSCINLDFREYSATNRQEGLAPGEAVVPKGRDNCNSTLPAQSRDTHSKKSEEHDTVLEISTDSRTDSVNESIEETSKFESKSSVPKKRSNHDECKEGDCVQTTGRKKAVSKTVCVSDHRRITVKKEWTSQNGADTPKSVASQNVNNPEKSNVTEHFRKLIRKLSKMSFEHPTVLITVINSPSEFFVHCISDLTLQRIGIISSCLKDYLSHLCKVDMSAESRQLVVKAGAACCGLFSEDDTLYRAMVIKVQEFETENEETTLVFITYLDYGNSEWLPSSRLFPLPKEIDLSVIPPSAVRCCLACIMPPLSEGCVGNSMADISDNWHTNAREQFFGLTGFVKTFKMFIVPEPSNDLMSEGVDDDDPVPVILVDPSGREECVNSLLVGKGVAWFVKPPDDPISDELRHLDDWDPAAEDFLSERNSYDVEVDDVGVAIVGVKVKDESNICKFFRKRSGCSRGERCPFRHVAPQPGTYTQDQVKVYVDTENELSITLPEEGRWVGVQIRAIYSPHCFYINLPWGNRYLTEAASLNPETQGDEVNSEMDLTDLVHFMTTHYNSCQFKGNKMLLPAIGEIVAARFTCDDKWYRAKVIFSENEKNVKVFYLDFGNAEVLSMARIHPIEPQFLQLPFQAIECTLKGVEPVSGQSIWTNDAIRCFSDLVLEKSLIAFVSKRFVDMTRLELSLFDPSRSCGCIVTALCAAGYSQPVMARNKETKS